MNQASRGTLVPEPAKHVTPLPCSDYRAALRSIVTGGVYAEAVASVVATNRELA